MFRGNIQHRLQQTRAIIINGSDTKRIYQIRKGTLHHVAVFNDIGHTRRGARIVFQNTEYAVAIPDQINAADMDIGPTGYRHAFHLGAVILVPQYQVGRNNAVLYTFLVVINIPDEFIQGFNALRHPAFDIDPFVGPDDTGQHIKGKDAIDHHPVAIDREGDAKIIQFARRSVGSRH